MKTNSVPGRYTYTTAPEDYDYWYTQDQGVVGHTTGRNPKPVRLVMILENVSYQTARYHSSCVDLVVDQTDFDKLVANGLVKLVDTNGQHDIGCDTCNTKDGCVRSEEQS